MTPYPITLNGTVWFDKNGNANMDASETVGFVPITIKVKGEDVSYSTMADADGRYSYTLVPGQYQITAQYSLNGRNYSRYINTVNLEEGKVSVTNNLELSLKYEITGTVYDYLKGVPVADAVVDFLDEHGNTIEDTTSDENGEYNIVITEGEYILYSHVDIGNRVLAILERTKISKPNTMDINLFNGVNLSGVLYSGEVKNGIDIGEIDILAPDDIVINSVSGKDGDYSILLPPGIYQMQADSIDPELTPDVEYILDREVEVTGQYNYEDYNIELVKKLLYGFSWEVDSNSKSAYIGYTANEYLGAEFSFTITNTGNESETVALTYVFDNITAWENMNFNPDTVDIKAGETEEVTFRLRPKASASIGTTAVITINASVTDEFMLSQEMEITVVAKKPKVGDAQIEYIKRSPSGDMYENDEFVLTAELTNPVEFSKGINLTAIFEHRTPSGQWEVIGKNVTTVSYRGEQTVSQTISDVKKGTHTYRVRVVPADGNDETDPDNNIASIEVTIKELPEEELSGWKGVLNPVNNNEKISYIVLIIIVVVIGGFLGYVASSKRRKRGRRYRKRHSR
jgi:hypothetical protein